MTSTQTTSPVKYNITRDSKLVVTNSTYRVEDLELQHEGKVVQTLSGTVLRPFKSTRGHYHDEQSETYVFISVLDSGSMQVGINTFPVEEGDVVYVPAGKFHRVFNDGSKNLLFWSIFDKTTKRPAF